MLNNSFANYAVNHNMYDKQIFAFAAAAVDVNGFFYVFKSFPHIFMSVIENIFAFAEYCLLQKSKLAN